MHVVVCVTGESFVVVGPFETGQSAERWAARKRSEPLTADLGTQFHVIQPVLPRDEATPGAGGEEGVICPVAC